LKTLGTTLRRERSEMKKLLALSLLLIASLSYAANGFQLNYTENQGTITILDDPKDWLQVYESTGMKLFVNNGGFLETKGLRILHSKVAYKEPKKLMDGEFIHYIYSYGLVDCDKGVLHLVGELYTNQNFEMIYKRDFELGEFVADITKPGTAANEVYGVICRDYLT